MKKIKNKLDERQEQALLHIEKFGCWFAFWALLFSIIVQQCIFGFSEIKYVAGEWIIFMVLAVYLLSASLKNGIWDSHLNADPKTNLIVSIVTAIVFPGIFSVISYINYKSIEASLATFIIMAIPIFVLCFAALSLFCRIYNKRVTDLESEDDSDLSEE